MHKLGSGRKRKDENRQFQDIWTSKYFFVESFNKVVCLICKDVIAVPKEYNIKRHYESRHLSFSKLPDSMRQKN